MAEENSDLSDPRAVETPVLTPKSAIRSEQVALQCRAVAHMAQALAAVHEDFASMITAGALADLLEMKGRDTARLMETLGDILNGMDAVADEDDWMAPVFDEAQRLWPHPAAIAQATGEGR